MATGMAGVAMAQRRARERRWSEVAQDVGEELLPESEAKFFERKGPCPEDGLAGALGRHAVPSRRFGSVLDLEAPQGPALSAVGLKPVRWPEAQAPCRHGQTPGLGGADRALPMAGGWVGRGDPAI